MSMVAGSTFIIDCQAQFVRRDFIAAIFPDDR